ncbi:MAG: DegV family EDD domain-containing protein [Mycoplasmataceae bacterium]|jgi:DegV family protein with EDD domain|nr:DegV family EDD domain-containing protein [Mycoplasmataceae bacterium]
MEHNFIPGVGTLGLISAVGFGVSLYNQTNDDILYKDMLNKNIAILVDSSVQIEESFCKENHIFSVPLSLSYSSADTTDSNSQKALLDDGKEITREKLFSLQEENKSFKTASTPLGILTVKVEELLETYDQVVFFPISHGLSGQYASSLIVKADLDDQNKFHTVKTTLCVDATFFVIKSFINNINNGVSTEEAVKIAEQEYHTCDTYFGVKNVKTLVNSGRIGKVASMVLNVAHLTPILTVDYSDGKIHKVAIGTSFKKNVTKIIKCLEKDYEGITLNKETITDIRILDGGISLEQKNYIREEISNAFGFAKESILISLVPIIILCHTGEGAYGIEVKTNTPYSRKV